MSLKFQLSGLEPRHPLPTAANLTTVRPGAPGSLPFRHGPKGIHGDNNRSITHYNPTDRLEKGTVNAGLSQLQRIFSEGKDKIFFPNKCKSGQLKSFRSYQHPVFRHIRPVSATNTHKSIWSKYSMRVSHIMNRTPKVFLSDFWSAVKS